jgi:hypothetical protein
MRKSLIALGLLAGCTQSNSSTSLADLAKKYGDTQLEVVANGQLNIELHVAPSSGCPELSEELAATFDDRTAGTIEWENVATITSAETSPSARLTIDHNIIHYPKGTDIEWVEAYAHPVPSRCDGPSLCTIDLQGTRDWVINP